MKKYFFISGIILSLLMTCTSYAEKETTNERLIRLEESVKNIDLRLNDTNKQIALLRQDMNKQNDLLRQDMNKQNDLLRQDMNKQNDLLRQDMNIRFEDSNNRNNERYQDMRTLMYVIFGGIFTIIALICGLITYIIFDRKTVVKPVKKQVEDLEKAHKESLVTILSNRENITVLENKIKQIWDRFDQGSQQVLNPGIGAFSP
ncbi:conserved hypothetical protein, membrane [Candidatus Magnetomorum sp. HK-1]|nr:conserved hypothetical protein, membrane [Candidatus Magnetomorum sp. HK-1]